MTKPGWDDERLAAAFHARFDRTAPRDIATAVHDTIVGTTPARPSPFSRFAAITAVGPAAAAAVVVVAIGAAVIGLGGFRPTGDGVPPVGTSAAPPSAAGSATASSLPASVLGLPVVGVGAALAVRDAGVDDRELAVAGWFAPAPIISCGPAPKEWAVSPVQLRCPDQLMWLMEEPESLVTVNGNQTSGSAPGGPALNPDLDDLDRSWEPPPWEVGMASVPAPARVVLLGHFDDRRSLLCPSAELTACRDRFVVDRVAWVDGSEPPPSTVDLLDGATARSSLAEIRSIVGAEAPDSPVLSIVTVDGALGLRKVEPALGTGRRGLIDQPFLWVVRVLESERISTYVVVDGTDAIFEMTEDGDAVPVGGSLGPPAGSPSTPPAGTATWPPAGSILVELASEVGVGGPPARAAVVDLSGRLVGVANRGQQPLDTMVGPDGIGAYREVGLPGRVHLLWESGLCDDEFVVTVAADLRSITVGGQRGGVCRLMLVYRELILDFSGPVDVSTIELMRTVTIIN